MLAQRSVFIYEYNVGNFILNSAGDKKYKNLGTNQFSLKTLLKHFTHYSESTALMLSAEKIGKNPAPGFPDNRICG